MARVFTLNFGILMFFLSSVHCQPRPDIGLLGGIEFGFEDKLYLISTFDLNYMEAFMYCKRYGGSLVQPSSAVEKFLHYAIPSVEEEDYWIGVSADGVQASLASLASLGSAFINCEDEGEFCDTNVEGPYLDAEAPSCIPDSSCSATAAVFADGSSIVNDNFYSGYSLGDLAWRQCVADSFHYCSTPIGCLFSEWILDDCLYSLNFICEKTECPSTMIVPPFPYSDLSYAPAFSQFLGIFTYCGSHYIRTTVNKCARDYVELEKFRFGDDPENEECLLLGNGSIRAEPKANSCGSISKTLPGNRVAYLFHLISQIGPSIPDEHSVIQRTKCLNISIQCVYNETQLLQFRSKVLPKSETIDFTMHFHSYIFHVGMFLFPDDTFDEPFDYYKELEVQVPDDIYIGIQIGDVDGGRYVLQVQYCYAYFDMIGFGGCGCDYYDYPELYAPYSYYYLINDSCPLDSATTIFFNYVNETAAFKFSSFLWNTVPTFVPDVEQRILLECGTIICDPTIHDDCYDNPCDSTEGGRRRRAIDDDQRKIHKTTFGPFTLKKPVSSSMCQSDNGGCSHHCATKENGESVCGCPAYMRLESDGKTCSPDGTVPDDMIDALQRKYSNEKLEEEEKEVMDYADDKETAWVEPDEAAPIYTLLGASSCFVIMSMYFTVEILKRSKAVALHSRIELY